MNSFRIRLWQTECNELIDMTGALQEIISTAQFFPGRNRQLTTAQRGDGGRTHFQDVLSDSGFRQEPSTAKARLSTPGAGSTPNKQKLTTATYSQSTPSQPDQLKVASSADEPRPAEQLNDEGSKKADDQQTAGPEPLMEDATASASDPQSAPLAAAPLAVQSDIVLAQLTLVNTEVTGRQPQQLAAVEQAQPELQIISANESAPVLDVAVTPAAPSPEANPKSKASSPDVEIGLQIDQGWVAEKGEKPVGKPEVQLPVAFSVAMETQPKAEPTIDLLNLRVHVSSKVIAEAATVDAPTSDRSAIEKPVAEAIDNTAFPLKQLTRPVASTMADQDANRENPDSGQHEPDTLNTAASASPVQTGNSTTDKFSMVKSSPISPVAIDEPQAAGRKNVSQLVLHLGESNESRVTVRVQSNALGVKMDIQGNDPQLRSSLRDSLSNLEKALDTQGISSNWAVPGANNDKLGTPPTGQTPRDSEQGAAREGARQQREQSQQGAHEESRRRRQSARTEASFGSWNNSLIQGARQ